jgi:sulfur-oxidizing protein SoxY
MADSATFAATRREFLAAAGALGLAPAALVRPAGATPASMAAAIADVVKGAKVTPGRVTLAVPPLIENGNVVPLTVAVDSPMTEADHVRRVHVFNEKNPQPHVATFHLGPRSGRASVSTRIRLADSQRLVAVAELSDGSLWSAAVEVVVTLAACVEN